MKMFRKMVTLVLTIVVICMFAVAAFAFDHEGSQSYYGEAVIESNADVERLSTFGSLYMVTPDIYGNVMQINVSYTYFQDDVNNPVVRKSDAEVRENTDSCYLYPDVRNIIEMEEATYSFYAAYVSPSYGIQEYSPLAIRIPYMPD